MTLSKNKCDLNILQIVAKIQKTRWKYFIVNKLDRTILDAQASLQLFHHKCDALVVGDAPEHWLVIVAELLVCHLRHHLEPLPDEGLLGEVPGGLGLGELVAEALGQQDRPPDQVSGQTQASGTRVRGQDLQRRDTTKHPLMNDNVTR